MADSLQRQRPRTSNGTKAFTVNLSLEVTPPRRYLDADFEKTTKE